MKKLNKKGFTLVELLAVIVILAVIMVITIPTVLGSMSSAKASAAQNAIAAIQKYIDDETELCKAGLGSLAPADASIFIDTTSCRINTSAASIIIKKAGYEKEFSTLTFKVDEVLGECTKDTDGPGGAQPASGIKECTITTENDGYRTVASIQTNQIATVTVKTGSQFGNNGDEITAK